MNKRHRHQLEDLVTAGIRTMLPSPMVYRIMTTPHNCHCPSCGKCYSRPQEQIQIAEMRLGYYVMTCYDCLTIPVMDRDKVMIAKIKLMERRRLGKRDKDIILKYPHMFNGYDPVNPYGLKVRRPNAGG